MQFPKVAKIFTESILNNEMIWIIFSPFIIFLNIFFLKLLVH